MNKQSFLRLSFILLTLLRPLSSHAGEWESLGSSEALLEKAASIDPENKVRVVQKRAVDRHWRVEFAGHYGLINGGDSYIKTKLAGGQVEVHINPHWSLGYRYDQYMNDLTPEGVNRLREADELRLNGDQAVLPDVDFPLSSQIATISWYPIYGKLNLFDSYITQFDLYFLAGAGKIILDTSGAQKLVTAGGGAGLWFNQYLSGRLEARYQGYKDPIYTTSPQVNSMILNISLGILL